MSNNIESFEEKVSYFFSDKYKSLLDLENPFNSVMQVAKQADQQLKDAHKRIAALEATINKLSPTGNSVIYVETPGDPDAGIFSHGFRFDIGFEIEDGEKEDFKEILSKAFSDVIGETAYIQFQCDIDKENEYFKQQLKPAEAE